MSMVRTHGLSGVTRPMRLLYSVRDPDSIFYRGELDLRALSQEGLTVDYVFTRVFASRLADSSRTNR